jgi:uncharacterized repeat protein (TIGR04138 family)
MDSNLEQYLKIEKIVERDPRYRVEAYTFVMEAVGYTLRRAGLEGHVTASELMQGIRDYALEEFGPLAKTVFNHWGITHASQFGDLVFNLIDAELLGKRAEDKREDFDRAGFDLDSELADRS